MVLTCFKNDVKQCLTTSFQFKCFADCILQGTFLFQVTPATLPDLATPKTE